MKKLKKYFIPSYSECREICDANDNFTFFETKHNIEGYNISLFLYRLAMPSLFFNPVPNSNLTAHELRGISFVFNSDGSIYSHYLLMDKFFNLGQHETTFYELLKGEKIKEITYKEDGSIISFIKLPNNKVIAKTKGSFESYQALEAQKIYNDSIDLQKFLKYCFNNNLIAIFEFVSPSNRVVLQYTKTDLVLIKLRNNLTGEYISFEDIKTDIMLQEISDLTNNITLAKTFADLTLDNLISNCEVDKGYEGYVVTFENGEMIKLKLLDYIALHNLHTEDLHREDSIIYLIIEEQIDDILCQLDELDERRAMILNLIEIVNKFISKKYNAVMELLNTYNGNKKDFAIKNIKNINFSYAMSVINHGNDLLAVIKKRLLEDTYRLFEARKWIDENK